MSKEKGKDSSGGSRKVQVNEEKGLKPAQNPPAMPQVKPPKSESKGS